MKKKLVFIIASLIFLIVSVNAQDKAQDEYIIKKGDTLWDISDTKLEDYFLWPRLWNVNPHIENPDLIYPGDKIRIPSREELMRMFPAPKKRIPAMLKPKRKKPETKSVFEAPERALQKYIVSKDLYISSGWISEEFHSVGEVTYSPMNRQITGRDNVVYLKFSGKKTMSSSDLPDNPSLLVVNNEGVESENTFFTVRDIKVVEHPITGEELGHQIRVTGILEVIGIDSDMPKAKIINSYEDVDIGDGLLPYQEMEPPLIPDEIRTPDIEGYIIESHMNTYISGEDNIIFLDKGQDDGLQIGDVFSVFSELPVERSIGKIQIISLQPTTSAAVISESDHEIIIGAKWGNK